MKKALVALILLIITSIVSAKSFGVIGEVFPIKEESFLDFIMRRLEELKSSHAFNDIEQKWLKKAKEKINRPTPVGLKPNKTKRIFYYNPTLTLSAPILDANNNVLFAAGTVVNPLLSLPTYKPCWLFFNADSKQELQWAKRELLLCHKPKLILVDGAIKKAQKFLRRTVYFDQAGRLSKQFKLRGTPVKITRKDARLKVEEIVVGEGSHAI